jgi:DNA-directed RNA polymerase alpha subunit
MNNLQLKTPISECGFSKRTQSVLKSVNIEYLEELSNMYNTNYLIVNIRRWRNAGRKTFTEIEDKIKTKGLSRYRINVDLEPFEKEEKSIADGLFAIAKAIEGLK